MAVRGTRYQRKLILNNDIVISTFGGASYYGKDKKIFYYVHDIDVEYDSEYKRYKFKPDKLKWSKYKLKYLNYAEYKIKKILKRIVCCKIKRK